MNSWMRLSRLLFINSCFTFPLSLFGLGISLSNLSIVNGFYALSCLFALAVATHEGIVARRWKANSPTLDQANEHGVWLLCGQGLITLIGLFGLVSSYSTINATQLVQEAVARRGIAWTDFVRDNDAASAVTITNIIIVFCYGCAAVLWLGFQALLLRKYHRYLAEMRVEIVEQMDGWQPPAASVSSAQKLAPSLNGSEL